MMKFRAIKVPSKQQQQQIWTKKRCQQIWNETKRYRFNVKKYENIGRVFRNVPQPSLSIEINLKGVKDFDYKQSSKTKSFEKSSTLVND